MILVESFTLAGAEPVSAILGNDRFYRRKSIAWGLVPGDP